MGGRGLRDVEDGTHILHVVVVLFTGPERVAMYVVDHQRWRILWEAVATPRLVRARVYGLVGGKFHKLSC